MGWNMELFNLPSSCKVDKNISKEIIYKNADADDKFKRIFIENVEKIKLQYLITHNNSNIEKYVNDSEKYEEIQFYVIEFRKEGAEEKIANLLHGIIPKPTIIKLKFNNNWKLSGAIKKIINNRIKIEEIITTPWFTDEDKEFIESLNYRNFNPSNLKTFYSNIIDRFNAFKSSKVLGIFSLNDVEKNKEKSEKIINIQLEIVNLKKELNKEKHNYKKAEIIKKIKKLNEELK